ncbi:golgin subfamily A member 6-like protein 1 [Helianthus annuus]|uniref:golgin subfamily A member 6-like protein 1 n=1 Tax=Helianthus annuus TaxID=4232 RepID=UPI00165328F7|nr:golgin subfamily A member 6-like protein 1 [Helianthus annuus]
MMLKNSSDFVNYSLSEFIEKIEAHELELVKVKKMNSANMPQDVSLYYKSSPVVSNVQSPKIQTGFSADNTSSVAPNAYQSSQSTPFANYEPNVKVSDQNSPQSSTGSNQQTVVSGVQCNIAINIKNGNEITENAAKQHIALLGSVLEAYEGKDDQAMMAEVVEITETGAEPEVFEKVVTESVGEEVTGIVESGSEVVDKAVTEAVESVSEIMIEEVIEVVDQEVPEIVKDVSMEDSEKNEETVSDVLSFKSRREEFVYTMKSILPPNVFGSFADYFEDPRTGTCPRFEAEKEEVEEMIDVSKEMTEETLQEIADKALMSKLKEVDSDIQESVDKVSGLGEESEVLEVNMVKLSELESNPVGINSESKWKSSWWELDEKMKKKAKRVRERENRRMEEKRGKFLKKQQEEEKAEKLKHEKIRIALSRKPKGREEHGFSPKVSCAEPSCAENSSNVSAEVSTKVSGVSSDKPELSDSVKADDMKDDEKTDVNKAPSTQAKQSEPSVSNEKVQIKQQEPKRVGKGCEKKKPKHQRRSGSPQSSMGSNRPKKARNEKNAFVKPVCNGKCEKYAFDCANKAFKKTGEISEQDL